MLMKSWLPRVACSAVLLLLLAAPATNASAQNVLANPGFESGLTGWTPFGNAYAEASNPPQFVPLSGTGLASMFGNFSGGFNVTGIFQEFACSPGDQWQISSNARFWSGDPMIGSQAAGGNWVVQKMAFFDASNAEIGGAESIILDGSYTADVWHPAAPVVGVAPAGTVKVQALILYLQPAFDGGAAHVDDVEFVNVTSVPVEETTWGHVKSLYAQ